MKKFFKEFKAFINRGNVMDLAVGLIIGSAFTAIVSSLVNNILTPLINWIPGSGNTGALQTVLRPAVVDAQGNVLTPALYLDWGAVIGAIITFLSTALVLFLLVKAFNRLKEAGEKGRTVFKEVKKKIKDEETDAVIVTETIHPEPPAEPKETTEELLKEIIALLKERQK